MENLISTNSSDSFLSNENIYEKILNIETKYRKSDISELSYGLPVEVGKDLFRYLKNFNLTKDPDLLILPPNNHYYFDENELRHIRTLINLKNLNLVKNLDSFLHSLVRLMPPKANFIGYFSYNKFTFSYDYLFSGLTTRFNNLLDLKTNHNLDEKELSVRMRKYGFRIIDMTEINGHTFFYSQTVRHTAGHMA